MYRTEEMHESTPFRSGSRAVPTRWIALLGRRDMPTDGVEDYCIFLGRGLCSQGIELERVRVPFLDRGWFGALRQLWRDSAAWRGQWVLLQYTAFSWSRRGFPFPALLVLAVLRQRGARVAVVFHEPRRQGYGRRWIDRLRGTCQDWVIRQLYRAAAKSVFTVPLKTISWLPKGETKAAFIPIGANIPDRFNRGDASVLVDRQKTVIVFGVTGAPTMNDEVQEIAAVMRETTRRLGPTRLLVVGRGSVEAREQLGRHSMGRRGSRVLGILTAECVSEEFGRVGRAPLRSRRDQSSARECDGRGRQRNSDRRLPGRKNHRTFGGSRHRMGVVARFR